MHYSVRKIMLLLPLVVFTVSIVSCEKTRQRTLYGRIVQSNTKSPIVNGRYELAVTSYASGINGSENTKVYPFATDDNGEFRLIFDAKKKKHL